MINRTLFKQEEEMFTKRKEELKQKALQKEKEFLNTDFRQLKNISWLKYFKSLTNYYVEFSLFNNPEIRKKFNEAGLNNFWLKWLVSFEQIEKYLDKIISDGKVRVLRAPVLDLIRMHLKIKILHNMMDWQDMMISYNKEKVTMAKKIFIDLYRKRDYNQGEPKVFKDEGDKNRNKILSEYEQEFKEKETIKKELFQLASGNTNHICIRQMIKCFIDDGQTNMTEYCNILYDFLLLIIKDDLTMYATEGEYIDKAPETYNTFKIYKKEKIYKTFIRKP